VGNEVDSSGFDTTPSSLEADRASSFESVSSSPATVTATRIWTVGLNCLLKIALELPSPKTTGTIVAAKLHDAIQGSRALHRGFHHTMVTGTKTRANGPHRMAITVTEIASVAMRPTPPIGSIFS
jgi:hypothetical protein